MITRKIQSILTILLMSLFYASGWAQTECQISEVPQTWDLESVNTDAGYCPLPSCWTTAGAGGCVQHYQGHSGNKSFAIHSDGYLIFPQLNTAVLPIESLKVSFYAKVWSGTHEGDILDVGVMSDPTNTSTFTTVVSVHGLTTNYQVFECSLSGYTGSGTYIAIRQRPSTDPYSVPSIYLDDFTLEYESPCHRPAYLTTAGATDSSVVISWSGHNTLFPSYILRYRRACDSEWQTDTFSTVAPSHTLTGLEHSWEYEAVLVPACDMSRPSNPFRFSTLCSEINVLPYTWDFETNNTGTSASGAMPACWSVCNSNNWINIERNNNSYLLAHSGVNTLLLQGYSGQTVPNIAILPLVDTSIWHIQDMQLSFYANGGSTSTIEVGVMTDPTDAATFTSLQSFTGLVAPAGSGSHIPVHRAYDVPLNTYTGNGSYIAIKGGAMCYIDDVTLMPLPSCARPSQPEAVQVKAQTAVLRWYHVADSTRYFVYYKPDSETDWLIDTVVGSNTDTNIWVLHGLQKFTDYTAYIVAECSPYTPSLPTRFTTICSVIDQLPQIWDFEAANSAPSSVIPDCWTRSATGVYFTSNSIYTHSGQRCLRFQVNQKAALPMLDTTVLDIHNLQVSFYARSLTIGNWPAVVQVGVMTNPNNFDTFTSVSEIEVDYSSIQRYEVSLAEYDGNGIYIALAVPLHSINACFIDDLRIDTLSACLEPSNVSVANVEGRSATVSWMHTSDEPIYYYIQYKPLTATTWLTDTIYNPTPLSCTLHGLQPTTEYQVRVVAECRSDVPSDIATFTTTCATIDNVPQFWDFETNNTGGNNSLPFCWSLLSSTNCVYVDAENPYYPNNSYYEPHSGSKFLRFYNTPQKRPIVVLPAINRDSLNINELQVSFYLKNHNPFIENILEVGVMSDPTDSSTFTALHTIHAYGEEYHAYEMSLSGYTGTGAHIALRGLDKTGWYNSVLLDDLRIDTIPNCLRPSNLTYTYTTDTSAFLTWTGFNPSDTNFAVYYKRMEDSVWNSQNFTTDSPEYLLTGLVPSSAYQTYVTCNCRPEAPSNVVWFNTECGAITSVPTTWDFESGYAFYPDLGNIDYCWTLIETDKISAMPPYTPSEAHSGGANLRMYASDAMAIMPRIDTSLLDIHDLQISFYVKKTSSHQLNADFAIQIGMLTDVSNTSTFEALYTFTDNGNDWHYYCIPLSSYSGDGTYPAIRLTPLALSLFYATLSVDDVTIEAIPECPTPSLLTTDSVTENTITFSWLGFNPEHPGYELYYKPVDDEIWNSVPITVSSPTFTLTGLAPASLYQLYLSPQCDTSIMSEMLIAGTQCSPITSVPRLWDFEGDEDYPLPYCWSRHIDTYYEYPAVVNNAGQSLSGTHCVQFASYERTVSILPDIDFDFSALQLSLSIKASANTQNAGVSVGVMSDPSDTTTFETLMHINSLTTQYQIFDIPLSDYTGSGTYLAVLSEGNVTIYLDDVSLDSIPACPRPSNLTAGELTTESAVLHWAGYNPTESDYTLYYKRSDLFVWDSVTVSATTASYTLTGLTPSTYYQAYLAPVCDPSKVSNTITFRTDCGVFYVPQTWDFEDVNTLNPEPNPISECWSRIPDNQPHVCWTWGDNIAHSGLKALRFISQESSYGILPYIDTSHLSISDLQVSFYAVGSSDNQINQLTIGMMTDPTDTSTFVPVETLAINTNDYTLYTVPLYSYTGDGAYIAIFREGLSGFISFIHVDDVTLDTLSECVAPVNLMVDNVTTNTAHLTWMYNDANAPFVVYYRLSGASVWQTDTAANGFTHTLTGLQAGRNYEAYVAPLCNASVVSQKVTFFTECMIIDSLPMFWDFEEDNISGTTSQPLPRCWTRVESSQCNHPPYVYTSPNYSYSGTHSLDFWQAKGCYAIMPMINTNILPINTLQLSFYMKRFANSPHCIDFGVMTDPYDTTTFVTVQTFTNIPNSYELYNISFSGYNGNGAYIAIREHSSSVYNDICIDDLSLLLAPGCESPQNLNAQPLSRSAILSWEHNADSTLFFVNYREVGEESPWMTDTATTADINGFVLDGLQPLHTYMVYVTADCYPPSAPSNTVSFTTPCAEDIIDIPQAWYFEPDNCGTGLLPPCWELIDVNDYPYYPSMQTSTAGGGGCLNFWKTSGNIAVLPYINNNYLNINNLEISFSIKDRIAAGNGAVEVGVMSDPSDPTTFTVVQTIDSLTSTYQQVVVSLDSYTGNGAYIALRDAGDLAGLSPNNAYDVYLDSLVISQGVVTLCDTPSGIHTTDIQNESIDITWYDNADVSSWNIQYHPLGSDWLSVTTSTNSYTLTGLTGLTTYEIRVQAVCNDLQTSDWSTALIVTTTNVGIDEHLQNSILLYPNPAKEYVDIRVDESISVTGLEVYDVYGKLINTAAGANNDSPRQTRINISGLADGVYFARITTTRGIVTKTFVKN